MSERAQLERGLRLLGLEASAAQVEALLAYLVLLAKWNRVYNLTAVRDSQDMVSHHLLDSLAVLPHLTCARLADIGSGAGLPGIPLAIMRPQMEVVSIETVDKKCAFQTQARIALGLKNFSTRHVRVEDLRDDGAYDGVISRAFSEISQFVKLSGHLLSTEGYLYAMKGVYPLDEIASLPAGFEVERVIQLEVPDLAAARHLVLIHRR